HDGIDERAELFRARYPADGTAPDRALQNAILAGALRRPSAKARARSVAGPAQCASLRRLARDERRRYRRTEGRRGDLNNSSPPRKRRPRGRESNTVPWVPAFAGTTKQHEREEIPRWRNSRATKFLPNA